MAAWRWGACRIRLIVSVGISLRLRLGHDRLLLNGLSIAELLAIELLRVRLLNDRVVDRLVVGRVLNHGLLMRRGRERRCWLLIAWILLEILGWDSLGWCLRNGLGHAGCGDGQEDYSRNTKHSLLLNELVDLVCTNLHALELDLECSGQNPEFLALNVRQQAQSQRSLRSR